MRLCIVLFLILIFTSCQKPEKPTSIVLKSDRVAENRVIQEHPGKKLMEINCYVCHNPTTSHENRIAPPMIAIKKHYMDEKTTKEEFIQSMQSWIKNPTEENAKMRGAIKRFGVMPKQVFPEETIKQIAEYMFDNTLEKPKWFQKYFNKKSNQNNNN